jgi:hypothetical protein
MSSAPPSSALLFIPDISGFTKFVDETEITHSQRIIQGLLEALLDANELDLVVSEIEGDAILFYRDGHAPAAKALLAQVRRMYGDFHDHLERFEAQRLCECGACTSASGLTVKFIVHYGEVGTNRIRTYSKLFGRDVILAHRLLKNEIPTHEYVLLTHAALLASGDREELRRAAWADPQEGESTYDLGIIAYVHIPLSDLRPRTP